MAPISYWHLLRGMCSSPRVRLICSSDYITPAEALRYFTPSLPLLTGVQSCIPLEIPLYAF